MNKALFLDRDGVINVDHYYVHKISEIEFIDGIFELCKTAKDMGYLLIVVTNQGGIAKGIYTEQDYHTLTQWMRDAFEEKGAGWTADYFCPDHPDGKIERYRKESEDRKPNCGMIKRAESEFGLDLKSSMLIGDKKSDTEAGRRAGVGRLWFLRGEYPLDEGKDVTVVNRLDEIRSYLMKGC